MGSMPIVTLHMLMGKTCFQSMWLISFGGERDGRDGEERECRYGDSNERE